MSTSHREWFVSRKNEHHKNVSFFLWPAHDEKQTAKSIKIIHLFSRSFVVTGHSKRLFGNLIRRRNMLNNGAGDNLGENIDGYKWNINPFSTIKMQKQFFRRKERNFIVQFDRMMLKKISSKAGQKCVRLTIPRPRKKWPIKFSRRFFYDFFKKSATQRNHMLNEALKTRRIKAVFTDIKQNILFHLRLVWYKTDFLRFYFVSLSGSFAM